MQDQRYTVYERRWNMSMLAVHLTYSSAQKPPDHLLVIYGRNVYERSQMVKEHNLENAATLVVYKAINGFSIVFTGARLRFVKQEGVLGDQSTQVREGDKYSQLKWLGVSGVEGTGIPC